MGNGSSSLPCKCTFLDHTEAGPVTVDVAFVPSEGSSGLPSIRVTGKRGLKVVFVLSSCALHALTALITGVVGVPTDTTMADTTRRISGLLTACASNDCVVYVQRTPGTSTLHCALAVDILAGGRLAFSVTSATGEAFTLSAFSRVPTGFVDGAHTLDLARAHATLSAVKLSMETHHSESGASGKPGASEAAVPGTAGGAGAATVVTDDTDWLTGYHVLDGSNANMEAMRLAPFGKTPLPEINAIQSNILSPTIDYTDFLHAEGSEMIQVLEFQPIRIHADVPPGYIVDYQILHNGPGPRGWFPATVSMGSDRPCVYFGEVYGSSCYRIIHARVRDPTTNHASFPSKPVGMLCTSKGLCM